MLTLIALTQAIIKSTNTLFNPAEGEREALTEEEGEADAEGLKDLEALLLAEAEGERDFEGELLGLGDPLTLPEGD